MEMSTDIISLKNQNKNFTIIRRIFRTNQNPKIDFVRENN